jgi:hypothetical protein
MAASSLFQVTALPLMHLSFLFNALPFTATFASVAKGAKHSRRIRISKPWKEKQIGISHD